MTNRVRATWYPQGWSEDAGIDGVLIREFENKRVKDLLTFCPDSGKARMVHRYEIKVHVRFGYEVAA